MDDTLWRSFEHDAVDPRDRYKMMSGAIVPRPIALVTTVAEDGTLNAAPISFFNCLSADPGILALGVETRDDGSIKDTGTNIRLAGEFCVNMVSEAMFEAMRICAQPEAPEVDEIALSGLTPVPSTSIAPPRLAEAPAAFECKRHVTLEISASRQIVLGRVTWMHYREDVIDAEKSYIRQERMNLVGRMSGPSYVRLNDIFTELPDPAPAPGGPRR
ncbi:flavin reductase family protein [Allosediminivita pacifica]|uniref:Flavin reductase (DIM6/NTAB) family NADH-FMN oxidoreductase RutF n=1 Tax=Allosediminivita pacifica TaxID=1267769 RepID=A0A2T6AR30_9RHOB|nr:flavin reductase family protein [Allosediminivita pacifica]PTX46250.1 flavin reductase (DIM6/NTAB) family NADH-FMN oxidoreductase RutF [Allosediminivita pacifica]GGB17611.1 flavin reductase [Allosediminivita pacifica]